MCGMWSVVSTTEKNRLNFMAVPSNWVKNKILYWPQPSPLGRSLEALRSDDASVPEKGWKTYPCTIKFTNINTYESALSIEEQLIAASNTDDEECILENMTKTLKKNNQKLPDKKNELPMTVEDDSFQMQNDENPKGKKKNTVQKQDDFIVEEDGFLVPVSISPTQPFDVKPEIEFLKREIGSVKKEVQDMKKLFEHDLKKHGVSLDQIVKIITDLKNHTLSTDLTKDNENQQQTEDLLEDFLPVAKTEDVEVLNSRIKNDPLFKKQLQDFLKKVGGTTGEDDGNKVGYKIVDLLFTPEVLTFYSWTGINRNKEHEKKIPFQSNTHIIGLLAMVLNASDRRFNYQKTSIFFKDCILKHALKRSQRKKPQSTKKVNEENLEAAIDNEVQENLENIVKETMQELGATEQEKEATNDHVEVE